MNEIHEILEAVNRDGISDDRLSQIRQTWSILGTLLDSAQSPNGLTGEVARQAWTFLQSQPINS